MSIDGELDKWAAWVLHRGDGDDPEQREKALEQLVPIRDRILDNARIRHGETSSMWGPAQLFSFRDDGRFLYAWVDEISRPESEPKPRQFSRPTARVVRPKNRTPAYSAGTMNGCASPSLAPPGRSAGPCSGSSRNETF